MSFAAAKVPLNLLGPAIVLNVCAPLSSTGNRKLLVGMRSNFADMSNSKQIQNLSSLFGKEGAREISYVRLLSFC
jgi:hypothetical protein